MTARRSETASASSWSWVTYTVVIWSSRWNPADLAAHGHAQPGVEVRERLVHEEEARAHHEGPGERDALLLAAGELAGHPRGELGHLDQVRMLPRPAAELGPRDAPRAEAVGDVLPHREVREDCVVLEDHPDVPRVRRQRVEPGAAADDAARVRPGEARDAPEESGLPAAARPEEREELARPGGHRDAVERGLGAVALDEPGHLEPRAHRQISPTARSPRAQFTRSTGTKTAARRRVDAAAAAPKLLLLTCR